MSLQKSFQGKIVSRTHISLQKSFPVKIHSQYDMSLQKSFEGKIYSRHQNFAPEVIKIEKLSLSILSEIEKKTNNAKAFA